MALTKISTGGVKDDAASQAKIADEAIDEARLQVSNAGSNGQFLQKQSGSTGGLTWATATTDTSDKAPINNPTFTGTVSTPAATINATGAYALKLNRSDSDGVFTQYTNSDTGTGTSDGFRVGIDANENALIWHRENKVVQIATNNSVRFRFGSDGQLGIGGATYGSSGQVLTSGGASAAPSWTTISAAPEITGTVSGTLAANEAVVVKSDGNLSKTIETITANDPIIKMQSDFFSSTSQSHIYDSQTNMWGHLHYHAALNKYVASWIRSSGGYKNIWVRTGTKDSNGDISWNTASQKIGNLETGSGQGMASVYHSNTGNIFFIWDRQSQNGVKCSGYNLSSNSAFDTNELVTGSDGYDSDHPIKVVQCGDQLVVNLDIRQSGDSGNFGYAMVGTVANTTVTWGDAYKWSASNTASHKTQDIIWDSTNSRVIVFGRTYSGGSNWEGVYRVGTISGTNASASISWGSLAYQTGANTGPTNTTGYHDVKNNKIVMLWIDGSNSSKITGKVGTINTSNNSISWGTAVAHSTETSNQMLECVYDPNTGLGTMWYRAMAHSNQLYGLTTSVSGTTLTFEAHTQLTDSSCGGDGSHAVSVDYDTVSKRVIGLAHKYDDNGEPFYGWTKSGSVSSNNTTFIGFSDAAYTNGQTATVKVTGNTSTQSGLTIGSKYYINGAGALTTDSDSNSNPYAGISLSATKLLIKG